MHSLRRHVQRKNKSHLLYIRGSGHMHLNLAENMSADKLIPVGTEQFPAGISCSQTRQQANEVQYRAAPEDSESSDQKPGIPVIRNSCDSHKQIYSCLNDPVIEIIFCRVQRGIAFPVPDVKYCAGTDL